MATENLEDGGDNVKSQESNKSKTKTENAAAPASSFLSG